jgi:hypothetical protein
MTTVASPRKIGTAWESAVVSHLNYHGFPTVERRALHGSKDIGDLTGLPGFLIGCKNERTIRLSTYMDELQVQKGNLVRGGGVVPFEVVKRRGQSPGRAYVVVELDEFLPVLRAMTEDD